MTTEDTWAQERDEIAAELTGLGLTEQLDFYLVGRFPTDVPSSEHVAMGFRDGVYRVWYKDMGERRELVESAELGPARVVFVAEAVQLAGGRGRGPVAQERP